MGESDAVDNSSGVAEERKSPWDIYKSRNWRKVHNADGKIDGALLAALRRDFEELPLEEVEGLQEAASFTTAYQNVKHRHEDPLLQFESGDEV